MAAAKKTTGKKKSAAKKSAAKKTAAKKTSATSAAKKKSAAKTTATKKRAATSRSAAKKSAAKTSAAKKTGAARASAPKKASTKKTAAKKTATTTTKKVSNQVTRTNAKAASTTPSILTNDRPDHVDIPKPRGTTKDGISYTKDFDVKFLKAQRDELLARRERELARATRLEDEAISLIEDGEMGDVQFDDEGGEGDTMVVQRDLDRVLSSQSRQSIADIDAALARIEAGTYGYSEVSGQPIPRERLEAIPETTVLAAEKVSGIGGR